MYKTRAERSLPAGFRQAYFPARKVDTTPRWDVLRTEGRKKLSLKAQLKLEWIIFYHTLGGKNAVKTAKHFGITRKTLGKWLKRFNKGFLGGLEELSKAPLHVRKRQISLSQRVRIKSLRIKFPRYGKMKMAGLYKKQYGENISSWKAQKIIEEGNLYYCKVKASRLRKRQIQARIHKRQRITKFRKENKVNHLWHVDTVVLTLSEGGYRYLLTAIDEVSKLAYARLYSSHSSRSAKDFLERLTYITENKVINIHHDNGSEFKKEFEQACRSLGIIQWYSRPHTPKDNAVLERFNRTIQEEFIDITDIGLTYVFDFNNYLLDWLIHYNFERPHQTLDYMSPLEYLDEYYKEVSPMYSSLTRT